MNPDRQQGDWLSFLGASYFRSSGELGEYGLSSRGVAINTGLPRPEEFPRFTHFWLEPAADPGSLIVHALLDGPSLSGAYRIEAVRSKGVIATIEAALFTQTAIHRLGVAPLTSMFWYSETDRRMVWDWRPEVHDSDGLAIWTGNGERIWRRSTRVRCGSVPSPMSIRGFGLFQRDRDFKNYQDGVVLYEQRPGLGGAVGVVGQGVVQLGEIPTRSEFEDNIVAYWTPKPMPMLAGAALLKFPQIPPALGCRRSLTVERLAGWRHPAGLGRDPLDARPHAPAGECWWSISRERRWII